MKSVVQTAQEQEYWFPYHYVSTMPTQGFSQHFIDTWGINYVSTIDYVLKAIGGNKTAKSFVDIGCGDGRLTREIKLAYPDCRVAGIDYSQRAINLAKAMNQDLPEIDFFAQDIITQRVDDQYDAAMLMEVYEHIPLDKTNDFLIGVRSCLKADGVLFLTVPHKNKPLEYKHFQHFSFSTLREQLERHFSVIEMVPFEKGGLARRMINRILCNRFYVLNNKKLLGLLYKLHGKYLFNCETEDQCQRIFVKATPKL
jgi:SAM-dependent methyltransferase